MAATLEHLGFAPSPQSRIIVLTSFRPLPLFRPHFLCVPRGFAVGFAVESVEVVEVTGRTLGMELKTFKMPPSASALVRHLQKNYPAIAGGLACIGLSHLLNLQLRYERKCFLPGT